MNPPLLHPVDLMRVTSLLMGVVHLYNMSSAVCDEVNNPELDHIISQDCHPSQMPRWQVDKASGQGSCWLIESPTLLICVICPPEICVNLDFKHIHIASSYTICR